MRHLFREPLNALVVAVGLLAVLVLLRPDPKPEPCAPPARSTIAGLVQAQRAAEDLGQPECASFQAGGGDAGC